MSDRNHDMLRCFSLCNAFGMTRPERLDLATTFLDRASTSSFNDLSPIELARLRDGLECAAFVCKMQMDRRAAAKVTAVT